MHNGCSYKSYNINCLSGLTEEISSYIPTSFKLHQNYPNPLNPLTTQKIDVPPIHKNPPARSGGKGVLISGDLDSLRKKYINFNMS